LLEAKATNSSSHIQLTAWQASVLRFTTEVGPVARRLLRHVRKWRKPQRSRNRRCEPGLAFQRNAVWSESVDQRATRRPAPLPQQCNSCDIGFVRREALAERPSATDAAGAAQRVAPVTTPHGSPPIATFVTFPVATSMIERSSEGPLAVNTCLPSLATAMPQGRAPTPRIA